jgi:hypothetical protein
LYIIGSYTLHVSITSVTFVAFGLKMKAKSSRIALTEHKFCSNSHSIDHNAIAFLSFLTTITFSTSWSWSTLKSFQHSSTVPYRNYLLNEFLNAKKGESLKIWLQKTQTLLFLNFFQNKDAWKISKKMISKTGLDILFFVQLTGQPGKPISPIPPDLPGGPIAPVNPVLPRRPLCPRSPLSPYLRNLNQNRWKPNGIRLLLWVRGGGKGTKKASKRNAKKKQTRDIQMKVSPLKCWMKCHHPGTWKVLLVLLALSHPFGQEIRHFQEGLSCREDLLRLGLVHRHILAHLLRRNIKESYKKMYFANHKPRPPGGPGGPGWHWQLVAFWALCGSE